MPPTLLEMPDVVMEKILEKLNYLDVQHLRRTCRDFRNFIDDINPDAQITSVDFRIEPNSVYSAITLREGVRLLKEYKGLKYNGIELLLWNGIKKLRWEVVKDRGEEFVEMAVKDLQPILINQKSELQLAISLFSQAHLFDNEASESQLEAASRKFLTNFKTVFKTRHGPIKAYEFRVTVTEQNQVTEILPLLDSESLRDLMIRKVGTPDTFDVLGLTQLEHWKGLKSVTIMNCYVNVPIRTFLHFEDVYVWYERITMDMVLEVKKAFLNSAHMMNFKIDFDFEEQNFEDSLMTHFGCHYRDFNRYGKMRKKWFYKIPENSERVLFITVDRSKIFFERNWEVNLPDGIVGE